MRVFGDKGGPPDDRRLREVRHGKMRFDFPVYRSREEWLKRAEYLRRQILVSNGLWPTPEKAPLNARIFGRVEREGYTVEKVYFESYPGFFVTGNLYRPRDGQGPFPGVLCPHGHWKSGRLENSDRASVPGRCISFARQGYVAFSYDMVGYNDSVQVSHRFGGEREALWGISLMGLQLWNSIRSVDFLTSLEQVDPDRIGCTGASGGGTQTFMLMAVDDRVKVAAPVNMVSANFQGGCLCENSPSLRIDTFNVEIAALMAPRPLLLVSATGDWTRENPHVEYPMIRSVYRLFDAEERVQCVQFDAPHNYNTASREAVYAWFGRWLLGITDEDRLKERPFSVEGREDLLVFYDVERPQGAVDASGLTRYLIESAEKQLDGLKPGDREGLRRFREVFGVALSHSLGAELPDVSSLVVEGRGITEHPDFTMERLLIGRRSEGDRVPSVLFIPREQAGRAPGTLIVHHEGKASLVDARTGSLIPLVTELLREGHVILAVDCFLSGESHPLSGTVDRERDVKFFTTFNKTDLALRVQDVLTSLAYLQGRKEVSGVDILGLKEAGPWCLLARGLATDIRGTAVDACQFDTRDDELWLRKLFAPGIRRAGGFLTAAALTAPHRLFIHNTGGKFQTDWITEVYGALDAEGRLKIEEEEASERQILEWLRGG